MVPVGPVTLMPLAEWVTVLPPNEVVGAIDQAIGEALLNRPTVKESAVHGIIVTPS